MNFVISILITITLCVFIEPLKPYWIIIFLVSLGITTGVIEKINEWRIVKRYKAKLEFLEPKIQSVNYQSTLKEINSAKNKFESLKLEVRSGGFTKKHANGNIANHLTAYERYNRVSRRSSKKYFRKRYN